MIDDKTRHQASVAGTKNVCSRLVGLYLSPRETFEEIGRAPRIIAPLLWLLAATLCISFLTIHRIGVDGYARQDFEAAVTSGETTQEEASDKVSRLTSRFSPVLLGTVVGFARWSKMVCLALLIAGWLKLLSLLRGRPVSFKPAFAVALYSFLAISLISSSLSAVLLHLKSPEEISLGSLVWSSLDHYLSLVAGDGLPAFVSTLASQVDVFALWLTALLVIGYAAVSPRLKMSVSALAIGGPYAAVAVALSAGAAFGF